MIEFDVAEIREFTKLTAPTADIDIAYKFYYDETNNIKTFYVREDGFNYAFTSNFILGGFVFDGVEHDLTPLHTGLKLQKTARDIKLKHLAKGEFEECLASDKVKIFLKYLADNKILIHYSSVNLLFYSLADIVDSAIANSEIALQAGPHFAMKLKNDLYKLAKLEIDFVVELFHQYKYPNIEKENIQAFIANLISFFDEYIDTEEFHFGLESFRQILKESQKKDTLPFIMDDEDHVMIKDFSHFYLRPIYIFKNSSHIFDNEAEIAAMINEYSLKDGNEKIDNPTFADSEGNLIIQFSDVFVGLLGKLSKFINTNSLTDIKTKVNGFSNAQLENLDFLIDVIDYSIDYNIALVHSVDCYEELQKLPLIRQLRGK